MLPFLVMTWHEQIGDTLAVYSSGKYAPRGLDIDESLRTALKSIEDPSTANPQTLRAVQVMAECAIHPMATGLARTMDNGIIARLIGLDKMWGDRTISENTEVYRTMHRVSQYYFPETGQMRPHEVGSALHAASELMAYGYPVKSGWLCNPEAQPTQGSILQAVGLFAVASHVHVAVCGRDSYHAAIESVIQNIEAIAAA